MIVLLAVAYAKRLLRRPAFCHRTDSAGMLFPIRSGVCPCRRYHERLALQLGWQLIDMKRGWKVIFPYELR